MKRLILFDIDGTLLTAGGAGITSCETAFNQLFGLRDVWGNTIARGKTDHLIFQEIAERVLGRGLALDELQSVANHYLKYFRDELETCKRFVVFPGVSEILSALAQRDDVAVGLETGNLEDAAWLKLGRAAIDQHFKFGGFGSDSIDRNEIVRIAIERGKAHLGIIDDPQRVVVIGDAIQDIIAGKASGALTVALRTGKASVEELAAERPDFILDDMSDVGGLIELITTR